MKIPKTGLDDFLLNHTVADFRNLPVHQIFGLKESLNRATPEITKEELHEIERQISKIKSATERDQHKNILRKKTGISKRAINEVVKHLMEASRRREFGELGDSRYDDRIIYDNARDNKSKDLDSGQYFLDDEGYLCRWKSSADGDYPQRLCNVDARIVEETIEDNGIDVTNNFSIEGRIGDKILPKVETSASQFDSLSWLHKWGNQAILEPGQTSRDFTRHAIQVRSHDAKTLKFYTHTGWREINKNWIYFTGSGAVGADDISVKLSREIQRYSLPLKPENEAEAIKASLSFLDIGKKEFTLPLWSLLYLSPLTTLLEPMPNFSGYIYAETGSFKTTLASLLLSHFGDFTGVTSLSNFSDTANSLEKRAFILKDALMVVDDFHPDSRKSDSQQKENLAQRLIRSYSNRTGRGRLNSDATDKGRYEPRGMLLITGEEIVSLQSTLARVMVIEYSKNDIDKAKLTAFQKKSGLLPHSMTSYVLWVKEHIQEIKNTFKKQFIELRDKASREDTHKKLPEQTAFLQFTLDTILSWMTDKGVIIEKDAIALSKEGWDIFQELSFKQSKRITQEDPVRKFIEIVQTLLIQEKVKFEHKTELKANILGGSDGELVGYYDDIYLYFLPQALWHSLQQYCIREGTHFPFSKNTFYKMLKNKKIVVTTDDKSTIPEWIKNKTVRVSKMYRESILEKSVRNVKDDVSVLEETV